MLRQRPAVILASSLLAVLFACDRKLDTEPPAPSSEGSSDTKVEQSPEPLEQSAPESPAEPSPKPAGLSGLGAGKSTVCEPPVFTECPAKTTAPGVDETLASNPTGTVTIAGAVMEVDTRCTNSVPPSCVSSLALTDEAGGRGRRLLLQAASGAQYTCSEPGGAVGCCTLATDGTRYAVTGTLSNRAGADVLSVDSVCRLR